MPVMIIGIDVSNIRAGGGVTHLHELLRAADPSVLGIDKIIIWGGMATLTKIDDRDWLHKVHDPLLERGLAFRVFWQSFRVKELAKKAECDVLFVPGGSDASGFKPMVTMSQNMLPFEWREMRRFGWSLNTLKFMLLRWAQSRSFCKADGVIFLTQYAGDAVVKVTGALRAKTAIIPHGINHRFMRHPRPQRLATDFKDTQPCRLLYVSIVDVYKHQCQVIEAVAQLRSKGVPVVLSLVGPPAEGLIRMKETLKRVDPEGAFISYSGEVPYDSLDDCYGSADIGVFASSCENMPNTLLECMAAGLPIACSNRGPMPEILGSAGEYFDPENPKKIAETLQRLISNKGLRERCARDAYVTAQGYSWEKCAQETFAFIADVAKECKKLDTRRGAHV